MTTTRDVSPEMARAVLTALLRVKEETGRVPAEQVRCARRALGEQVSERTLWRWIQRGQVPDFRRNAYTVDEDDRRQLLRCGSVNKLHENRKKAGTATVSARTMQRAFQREFGTADLTFIRSGFDAAHALTPTSAMPDRAINEEWSMDDTELPVWCVMPGGLVRKPQMQGIRDAASRYIISLTLAPYVFTTEDAVENIANAVAGRHTENGVFIGGKPRALRTDRGSIFITKATSLGLIAESIDRRYSAPYEPQGNGGIERWHKTIKALFRDVPGFDWSTFKQGDRRKAHQPPPVDQLLLFEELVALTLKKVREYNTEHVHSAHGMTPQECWERDTAQSPELVKRADGVALRAAMRQSEGRKVSRRRIQWDNRFYNLHPHSVQDPDESAEVIAKRNRLIDANEGKDVVMRFLNGRLEYVSVYTLDGKYLGDAVWDKYQTVAQAGETSQRRRRHIKTWTADLETITLADGDAIARRRADALADAGVDYSQYDDGIPFDPTSGEVLEDGEPPVDEATPGRKHRSSKAVGHPANKTTSRTTSKANSSDERPKTRAQQRDEQRRRDAVAAAEHVQRRRPA